MFNKIIISFSIALVLMPAKAMEPQDQKKCLHEELIKNHSSEQERRSKRGIVEPILLELENIAQDAFNIPAVLKMLKITPELVSRDKLHVTELELGTFSDIIYMVTIPQECLGQNRKLNTFVIKRHHCLYSRINDRELQEPSKESQNLNRINQQILPKLQDVTDLVEIPKTIQSAYYFDFYGQKRILSILEGVSGMRLDEWMISCEQGNIAPKAINMIMKHTGKALGLFHIKLATEPSKEILNIGTVDLMSFHTVNHNDLHGGNILYHYEKNKVYLIDVGSMADSLGKEATPLNDLSHLLLTLKFMFRKDPGFTNTLNNSFLNFAKGYSEAFPLKAQQKIESDIINYFPKWLQQGRSHLTQNHFLNSSSDSSSSDSSSSSGASFVSDFFERHITYNKIPIKNFVI